MNDIASAHPRTARLRVLLASTSYPHDVGDWHGVFMRHLVHALARLPEVDLAVWAPPGPLPPTATDMTTPREAEWLARLMAAGGISHLIREGGMRAMSAPVVLLRMLSRVYRRRNDVDVFHVNWLQCALPLPDNRKPALITVLGNDLKLLRLPLMRMLLRRVMRRRRVVICPNAEWMTPALQAAFGDIAAIVPVSFGIDPLWYAIVREVPPSQPRRWLAVTRLTVDKLGPLFEWSRELFAGEGRELHLFGPMQEDIAMPEWVHYHGSATPAQLANDWFPGACGLVTLSRHAEGRPQVMLEAMAAGLPIIASRMPAHATIVEEGKTGMLCDSPEGYRAALATLEDPTINQAIGEAARRRAMQDMGTWDDCAQRYLRLYHQLLVTHGDPGGG